MVMKVAKRKAYTRVKVGQIESENPFSKKDNGRPWINLLNNLQLALDFSL